MNDLVQQYFPVFFPVLFALLWLALTSLLGRLSGWYALLDKYPDREDQVLLRERFQSGSLRWVGMSAILTVSVCRTGLRIGMIRLFGPFCRDFFVPWEDIRVRRTRSFFIGLAELEFSGCPSARLAITADLADRLARFAGGRWPEVALPPSQKERNRQLFTRLARTWLVLTGFSAAFLFAVSRLTGPDGAYLPISVAILLPAAVFGLMGIVNYINQSRREEP